MRFLLSLIPLYTLLAAGIVIGIGTGSFNTEYIREGYVATTFILLVLVAITGFSSIITSVFAHLDNIASVNEETKDIENHKAHCTAIKEHIKTVTDISKELDDSVLAKSNVDHPVVKAMQELTSAEKDLRNSRNQLSRTKGRITARKRGPFGWVVNLYGEE